MDRAKDNRTLSPEQQEVIRIKAVEAVLAGMPQAEAARIFGVSQWSVCQWMKKARKKGASALEARKRGGQKQPLLTPLQSTAILRLIQDKHPEQLKLPFVLWTREGVQQLIEQKYSIRLAIRTIGDYLDRWEMTPQKPVARAYEQNPEAVKTWLEEEYPKIKQKAIQEDGVIFWEDEMGLRSEHQSGTSYAPKGQTPVVKKTGKRFKCNMIFVLSNTGRLHFSLFQGSFVNIRFIAFLKRLIQQNNGRKVFLILDGHPVHRAKAVQKWLEGKENVFHARIQSRAKPS
jgi:transposase